MCGPHLALWMTKNKIEDGVQQPFFPGGSEKVSSAYNSENQNRICTLFK